MDSITNILRDILCTYISLDDGLSAIQNMMTAASEDDELVFGIARAIEEILLRRPGLANIKLTELLARLFSQRDRLLPDLLSLLDTRYTCAFRRGETEILPDIEALPILIDMLGELCESISLAISLNLRPLLSFLTDEMVQMLEAIYERDHAPSTRLAVNEIHHVAHLLMDENVFDCAEVLLNRILDYAQKLEMREVAVEIGVDDAAVLTELGMYDQAREILRSLEMSETVSADPQLVALITLQSAVNETRDDTIDYNIARERAEQAIMLYKQMRADGRITDDDLGAAYLTVGSNILVTGWREAVREAIEWLDAGAKTYEATELDSLEAVKHYFKCLAGLGLAYGMLGDYDSTVRAIEYMRHARSVLNNISKSDQDTSVELARCDNAIGWICLLTESDEFWPVGEEAFKKAIVTRQKLVEERRIPPIELLSSRAGLALLQMIVSDKNDRDKTLETLHRILSDYIQLSISDSRALTEMAIIVYNIVWSSIRHDVQIPERLHSLIEEIDEILSEMGSLSTSVFIQGVSLVIPFLNKDWALLKKRASELSSELGSITNIAWIMRGLAVLKTDISALGTGPLTTMNEQMMSQIRMADQILAEYWNGQYILLFTVQSFYQNMDYSNLATGLYNAAMAFKRVESTESTIEESTEFIRATSSSMARVLFRLSAALERYCGIEKEEEPKGPEATTTYDTTVSSFILSEDWSGLIKILDSYIHTIEQAEPLRAQPYLNAVFSSVVRALRMMDSVSLSDRRALAHLTREMTGRFYLRS